MTFTCLRDLPLPEVDFLGSALPPPPLLFPDELDGLEPDGLAVDVGGIDVTVPRTRDLVGFPPVLFLATGVCFFFDGGGGEGLLLARFFLACCLGGGAGEGLFRVFLLLTGAGDGDLLLDLFFFFFAGFAGE